MTHDPLCPFTPEVSVELVRWKKEVPCQCDLIAKVRADERAKYVPDAPKGGEHVDWCRDLACYGCEEITEGVIARKV